MLVSAFLSSITLIVAIRLVLFVVAIVLMCVFCYIGEKSIKFVSDLLLAMVTGLIWILMSTLLLVIASFLTIASLLAITGLFIITSLLIALCSLLFCLLWSLYYYGLYLLQLQVHWFWLITISWCWYIDMELCLIRSVWHWCGAFFLMRFSIVLVQILSFKFYYADSIIRIALWIPLCILLCGFHSANFIIRSIGRILLWKSIVQNQLCKL